MKKKILFRCLWGAPLGVTVSVMITIVFSLCIGQGKYISAPSELIAFCGSEITAVLVQMLCSLFVGAACGGLTLIWEMEKWSLLKQTLIHFVAFAVLIFGFGYIMNWLPHDLYGALGFIGGFNLGYIILWCTIYLSIRAKIAKMNKRLQEMQEDENKSSDRA